MAKRKPAQQPSDSTLALPPDWYRKLTAEFRKTSQDVLNSLVFDDFAKGLPRAWGQLYAVMRKALDEVEIVHAFLTGSRFVREPDKKPMAAAKRRALAEQASRAARDALLCVGELMDDLGVGEHERIAAQQRARAKNGKALSNEYWGYPGVSIFDAALSYCDSVVDCYLYDNKKTLLSLYKVRENLRAAADLKLLFLELAGNKHGGNVARRGADRAQVKSIRVERNGDAGWMVRRGGNKDPVCRGHRAMIFGNLLEMGAYHGMKTVTRAALTFKAQPTSPKAISNLDARLKEMKPSGLAAFIIKGKPELKRGHVAINPKVRVRKSKDGAVYTLSLG